MPPHYHLCFNDECARADKCPHRLAARSGRQRDDQVWAVTPAVYNEKNCRYYKENKVATMAYGMVHSSLEVKADDISTLHNTLIRHFGWGLTTCVATASGSSRPRNKNTLPAYSRSSATK